MRIKYFFTVTISAMIVSGNFSIAYADRPDSFHNDHDSYNELKRQVEYLALQIKVLSNVSASQQKKLKELQHANHSLVQKLACVSNISNDTDFFFEGCNVHVLNGAGQTATTNGFGNLIIGYNKNEVATRTGSHNLILGDLNEYVSYSGIVSGTENSLKSPDSAILSSFESSTQAGRGVVIGGDRGITNASSVIVGGSRNFTSTTGGGAVVVGGNENHATASHAVAVGGTFNEAASTNSLACGGSENQATGTNSTVCGASESIASGLNSAISGGWRNQAVGRNSSVSGGGNNTANGDYSSILGGNGNVVDTDYGTSP